MMMHRDEHSTNTSDEDEANADRNPEEWLNLSLGKKKSIEEEERNDVAKASSEKQSAESSSRPVPYKVYSCNFCMRKFYSSQALGGHQNAHKRERGAFKHFYQSQQQKVMMMTCAPLHRGPVFRSLVVQSHSLIQKQSRDGNSSSTVAKFSEADPKFRLASWRYCQNTDEYGGSMWPGSFRFDQNVSEEKSSGSDTLDLNLKL